MVNDGKVAVEPALSAEEWHDGYVDWAEARGARLSTDGYCHIALYDDGDEIALAARELPALIALANHALPDGDPRKITRADVEVLEEASRYLGARAYADDAGTYERTGAMSLRTLSAKLRALLPREGA